MMLTIALLLSMLQIRILAGEGAVHEPGSQSWPGLVIELIDAAGQPVAGTPVAFRLPREGPGGAFLNGLGTEIVRTGPDGRATAPAVRWNRTAGRVRIRIAAAHRGDRAEAEVVQSVVPHDGARIAK